MFVCTSGCAGWRYQQQCDCCRQKSEVDESFRASIGIHRWSPFRSQFEPGEWIGYGWMAEDAICGPAGMVFVPEHQQPTNRVEAPVARGTRRAAACKAGVFG